jgi:peptidoglycan biosynthesis protein MviN/MurJ (putative lipid II flippase)
VALAGDLHLGDPAGRLRLGAVGLALGTGVAAWFELWRLRRKLASRLQHFTLPWMPVGKMTAAALLAALPAAGLWAALPARLHPLAAAAAVLPVLGVGYVILASTWGVAEAARWTRWAGVRRGGGG